MIDIHDDIFTCSARMRNDIIDFFRDKELMTMLEIGTHKGYTNKSLAPFFKKIIGTEILDEHIDFFKKHNQVENNEIRKFNVYYDDWKTLPEVDVVFIDCVHSYDGCKMDVSNTLKRYPNIKYIIFDDYEVWAGVHEVVSEFVNEGIFKIEKLIGLDSLIDGKPTNRKGKQEGCIVSIT